ncbi:CheR family methyltransferase [Limnoglobus roseus]|uniref:histidine kinase n=1 Tax=Limnoglobus roseus TaxID=2598579 RepID=A0A5C1ANE1_9BACT|nr:CheR family methyltransferase [Limnoglobus roseus]QEL20510.1 histidine kinase [Limnoglobus roseus]
MPQLHSPSTRPHGLSFPVVGVGASAGGLEAFTQFLQRLPARAGFAILLVQHLDPSRSSVLAEILSRETARSVREAVEGMAVEPDHVYVIPPDTRMGVEGGVIRLNPRGDRSAPHHPIDYLFRSLALAYGPRAVAVVLSGGGTDGTHGIGDIREAGGLTFAQSVDTAGQTGMPASAAAAGVDAVLSPEGIADALVRLGGGPEAPAEPGADGAEPLPDGNALAPLFAVLRERTGVDFGQYKQNTIRRRVTRRIALQRFAGVDALVRAVRDDPAELAALARDLLIGVTRFFRDPGVFDRFRAEAIPPLLRDRVDDTPLRVWVPGCSTGEEAYSLAIVLVEAFEGAAEVPVKILATDVNEAALARARAGVYPENIAEDVSPDRLRRHFRKTTAGYRVSSAVRDLCVFARHDLTADPPFARMDLVSCRNVLIYFDAALQRRVIPLFHYALRPGGYLLLGPSETIGPFADLFVPVGRDEHLYTRTLAPARLPSGLVAGPPVAGRPPVAAGPPREAGGLADVYREADRVLARYAPVAVLVDDNLNILQFRGDSDPYLRHPSGTAGLDLLRMAREGLLPDLRDGVSAARTEGAVIRRPDVRVGEGDAARTVTLQITPLAGAGPGLLCFLIAFEDADSRPPAPPVVPINDSELAERVGQLRRELEAAREHQQAVAEEYEATNEELKSANEEILASNEELQSTNEELQTAREEMQSANEELETVNEELEHRNRELGRTNDDLHSLLVGVNVPVVVVGRDLRIRRLTAQAEAVFGLQPADVGRSLRETGLGLDAPDPAGTVARVIDSLEATAFEARDRTGRWHSVRIRPYETGDNRIEGAVVTGIDIDAAKRSEAARRDLEGQVFQTQKLESLGLMAGGVAHDLNNLLTPIIGYAQVILGELPAGSAHHAMMGEVDQSARLATDLVQQLLSYSGMSPRENRLTDLSGLIRGLEGLLRRAAVGAELRFELAGGPLPVDVDPAQVSQVVMNLVTNAAEAAPGGRGTVTVRTDTAHSDRAALASPFLGGRGDLPEGAYATLEVSDDGSGMSADTQARMFDPFYTTKFTGRGLGLAAVLGIVRGHAGTVRVRSEVGRGTTVRVLLPLSHRPTPEVVGAPIRIAATAGRGSGTVLVVDDEKGVRGLVKMILKNAGFEVIEAEDGTQGLDVFRDRSADIRAVILDLTMPRMGGLALAESIRGVSGTVPILVMSGYGPEETASRMGGCTSADSFRNRSPRKR